MSNLTLACNRLLSHRIHFCLNMYACFVKIRRENIVSDCKREFLLGGGWIRVVGFLVFFCRHSYKFLSCWVKNSRFALFELANHNVFLLSDIWIMIGQLKNKRTIGFEPCYRKKVLRFLSEIFHNFFWKFSNFQPLCFSSSKYFGSQNGWTGQGVDRGEFGSCPQIPSLSRFGKRPNLATSSNRHIWSTFGSEFDGQNGATLPKSANRGTRPDSRTERDKHEMRRV